MHRIIHPGIASALFAALLFGASTPLAKLLLGHMAPAVLAGLLYLGSGIGLLTWFMTRRAILRQDTAGAHLTRGDLPWLAGAIACGGVLGPLLLMVGLARTSADSASLLLNLEGVFTALIAWFAFRENFDSRIALGMALITGGGLTLSWGGRPDLAQWLGPMAVIGACLCWALDNNLTRRISAADAAQIAGIKGLVAGLVNLGIAYSLGNALPGSALACSAALVGLLGYGVSLMLFIVALRHVGAARTGAYFSLAPFCGAALALVLLHEPVGALFWLAALLMAAGIALHLSERHAHQHSHEPLAHSHRHTHDAHHQHAHESDYDGQEPHTHFHAHAPLLHSHPHYPDIHHRHTHA
jgi:drug/metabolite transporter (DMT)-like permease